MTAAHPTSLSRLLLTIALSAALAACPETPDPVTDNGSGPDVADVTQDQVGDVTADADAVPDDGDASVDGTADADATGPDADVADTAPDADALVPDGQDDADGDAVVDAIPDALPDAQPDADVQADADADAVEDTTDGGADTDADADGPCTSDEECQADNPNPCVVLTCSQATGACEESETVDNGTACEDGNLCSSGETCQDGACVGGSAVTCNDDNPCTDDFCKPSEGCTFTVNLATCDDGDPCTQGDTCLGGVCSGAEPTCADDNPCTLDICDDGACSFPSDDTATCDDGSDCTAGDSCSGGTCQPGIGDGCDDGNPCTTGTCNGDGETCSSQSLSGEACEDGNACTVDDSCSASTCTPGSANTCDDGDDCTSDACDPVGGCLLAPLTDVPCDDGDACTSDTVCDSASVCSGGVAVECDDGNACTADSCDPALGCQYEELTGPCEDGDACTTNEQCVDGACVVEAVDCDDDDVCTEDQCDPVIGCDNVDLSAGCDDGDACTDDSCDPVEGCQNAFNTAPCDDGDSCTDNDACTEGSCAGTALDCNDDDDCTLDVCTVETGCVNAPFTGACDDGDACTTGESCEADGLCNGGATVDPDDQVDCTIDACDPADGITNTPDDGACDTGYVCDATSGCVAGDVKLLIVRVLLDPTAGDDSVDGQGQWFAVTNVGTLTADLGAMEVRNSANDAVSVTLPDGTTGPVLLAPGATLVGLKAPENVPADVPPEVGFLFGGFGDGFGFVDTGDAITLQTTDGSLGDTADFSVVVSNGLVSANAVPVQTGVPTDLDAAAAAQAIDGTANDDAADWCVSDSTAFGPLTDCGRLVLNEINFAAADGERYVELWAPAGGSYPATLLRFVDADGAVVGLVAVPAGRMPVGTLVLERDGVDGVVVPPLTAGAVQLLEGATPLDVFGFGTLNVTVDAQLGLPMLETAEGPTSTPTNTASRVVNGGDTDDNSVDFTLLPGSPGQLNP